MCNNKGGTGGHATNTAITGTSDRMRVFVSVETPYNSFYPWILARNIQYGIMCNTVEASHGHATWAPHLCNTQAVVFGMRMFFGDSLCTLLLGLNYFETAAAKYVIGRQRTLDTTNLARKVKCDAVVCFTDFGISSGMQSAIDAAEAAHVPVHYKQLPEDAMKHVLGQSFLSTVLPVATTCGAAAAYTFSGIQLWKWARHAVLRR